ncbi:hypothetical protein VHEMI04237 [[Torrubiella] hemipterigena]|uniref:Uncharacterized protein n=1 Tax=[Torrubiella] hemipterigena TaxID=1531966 RepID=A0A0A1SUS7_9HYPO|nr:hypothetical protein VHEMI04237 [[Torrubiella] hemipterigena]
MPSNPETGPNGGTMANLTTAFPTSFVYVQFDPNSNEKRKNAKSHAVRQGILTKRQTQTRDGNNFKHYSPSPARLQWEPFDVLPVPGSRLKRLLNTPIASRLVEPVFSLEGDNSFLSYQTVFRTGFQDEALPHALMTLLTHQQPSNTDHYKHKSAAIGVIQHRLASTQTAVLPSTIGAILMLASVECHLENISGAETHLIGVKNILALADKTKSHLPDQLRRAIFWQDLNSSLLIGTARVFECAYFIDSPLPTSNTPKNVPHGFQRQRHQLGDDFVGAVSQLMELEATCQNADAKHDAATMATIDDQQALIEDRLYHCWNKARTTANTLLQACALAAYICTYMMHTDIWQNHRIPSACAFKLLQLLEAQDLAVYQDVYLWLLVIGGTLSTPDVQQRYTKLWQTSLDIKKSDWKDIDATLQGYIWPRKISNMCKAAWRKFIP